MDRTTFEHVLDIAEDIANAAKMELLTITYWALDHNWTATYADEKGSSFVQLKPYNIQESLQELQENYHIDEDEEDETD